jgi:1-acyl-sn-glycerol-3-phosphate acyltransferase
LIRRLRSILFTVWLYAWVFLIGFGLSPLLILPREVSMWVIKLWARTVLWGMTNICGIRIEIRGLEHKPQGAALIAGKHLSMLDTIVPFVIFKDPCFVLKKELTYLPFFGWFALRAQMVPIQRADAAKALKSMVVDTKARLKDARQVVIFPEGTRSDIGAEPDYKPGVAALYRELEFACTLIATNSGQFWPAHGIDRYPGTVVFEFLAPLPPGLKRADFMAQMKTGLETASDRLIEEFKPMRNG